MADASGANAAQFSVWRVLTKVAKAQEGRAPGPTAARAAMSAITAASCASVDGGSGMPDSMRPSAASRCFARACTVKPTCLRRMVSSSSRQGAHHGVAL